MNETCMNVHLYKIFIVTFHTNFPNKINLMKKKWNAQRMCGMQFCGFGRQAHFLYTIRVWRTRKREWEEI